MVVQYTDSHRAKVQLDDHRPGKVTRKRVIASTVLWVYTVFWVLLIRLYLQHWSEPSVVTQLAPFRTKELLLSSEIEPSFSNQQKESRPAEVDI
jgi:hypothetical protein